VGSKAAGGGIAALGIVLTVIGVILYLYPEETSVFGIVVLTQYPYRDLGTVLLVLGIIITVVGAIVAAAPSRSSSPASHQAGQFFQPPMTQPSYQTYQQPIEEASQPSGRKFCRHCGRPNEADSRFCEGCGKAL
jgi:uncharacterized membrane protein